MARIRGIVRLRSMTFLELLHVVSVEGIRDLEGKRRTKLDSKILRLFQDIQQRTREIGIDVEAWDNKRWPGTEGMANSMWKMPE